MGISFASPAGHEPLRGRGRLDDGAARAWTEQLYTSYARTVGGLCRALLRDRGEAEDATQQVFLSAHRALLNGSSPREPAAWLATIARNECWARVQARRREPLSTAEFDAATGRPDPLTEAIRRADLTALWAAIEELPHQQREALLLREFGGLSYDELAAALTVTTPAIEALLFRARRSLRARLQPVYGALSGVSWADALARLFAGSSPAVATKALALGLSAAALTGGALVTPQLLNPNGAPTSPSPSHLSAPLVVRPAPPPTPEPPIPTPEKHPLVLFRTTTTRERPDDASERSRPGQDDATETAATSRDRPAPESGDRAETADTTASSSGGDRGDPTTEQPTSEPSGQGDGSETASRSGDNESFTPTTTLPLTNAGDGGD